MTQPVLCILNRPTQYDPPLWAALKRRGKLRPTVWYANGSEYVDPEIGSKLAWGFDPPPDFDFQNVPQQQLATRLASMQPAPVAVLSEGWANRYTWQLAWVCLKRGIPMILPSDRVADASEAWSRRKVRQAVRLATRRVFKGHITTGSLGTAALIADGVPPDRIATALYPIDVALFQSRLTQFQALSHELRNRWPPDAKVVVAVAKHVERESPLLLIEAFARLKQRLPSAKFLFVGDGPMRGAIENRIAELSLGDDVFLAGYVPYQRLPAYYGASDVFLHVAQFEPWGISVAEAMACGLPVVATASVGSTTDLVVPGITGAVSATADPEILAQKISQALELSGRGTTRAAILKQVGTIDVEKAAARIEALVDRLTVTR